MFIVYKKSPKMINKPRVSMIDEEKKKSKS